MKNILAMIPRHHLIAILVVANVFVGFSIVSGAFAAFNYNNNINLDGGGESYEIQDYEIPEVTPPSGADIQVQTSTNGTGVLSTYQTNLQVNADLWYAWNRGSGPPQSNTSANGYVRALTNPNVTIGYDVGVYDKTTNERIPENGTVTVGQEIKLKFGPYVPDNIYWFGTGYSMDSPYGEWRTNADAPALSGTSVTCAQKDFVVKYTLIGYNLILDVYIPLVVHPPTRSITNIPSGLSCGSLTQNGDGSSEMLCTVQSQGTLTPRFHFDSTFGKFYYRYYDPRAMGGAWGGPGCFGNNIPLATAGSIGGTSYGNYTSGGPVVPGYQLAVPVKDIDYPLIAGTPSTPPTTPTVTANGVACATSATVPAGQSVTFTATATDPDGDTIRYGFDWLNAGAVNEWVPSSGYVTSGTTQTVSHSWNSGGTYNVKVKAQDNHGASSGWSEVCAITVTGNVGQCADGTDNDSDGLIDCSDPGCHTDGNAANGASCDPGRIENPQCSDVADNDGDAKADTQDPGCHTDANASNAASYNPGDNDETNTQCSDGIDNNGNGLIDLNDTGACTSLTDNDESNNATLSLALAASSSVVQYGTTATMSWSATNVQAGSCRITAANGSDYSYDSGLLSGTSGQITTTGKPLKSQVTFTLTCLNLVSQTVNTTAVVRVTPSSGEF